MLKIFDFCAGIGGGRIALENNSLECVGHSEIDKKLQRLIDYFLMTIEIMGFNKA